MKVVCIDDHLDFHFLRKYHLPLSSGKKIDGLTVGKIYDITDFVQFVQSSPWIYEIIDDNGQPTWYNDSVLMPLEKYRELKLNELGI